MPRYLSYSLDPIKHGPVGSRLPSRVPGRIGVSEDAKTTNFNSSRRDAAAWIHERGIMNVAFAKEAVTKRRRPLRIPSAQGHRYRLTVETYHGTGGSWSRI